VRGVAVRLFAACLRDVVEVTGADDDGRGFAGFCCARKVCGEGSEATTMADDFGAVDPDGGVVVGCLEMEEDTAVAPIGGDFDDAAVPDGVHVVGVLDAGEFGFRAEGDGDGAGEFLIFHTAFDTGVTGVDFKLPGTVEVEPVIAYELRTGVFWPGDFVRHYDSLCRDCLLDFGSGLWCGGGGNRLWNTLFKV